MPRPAVILLVEDEPQLRELVRAYLADQDYTVLEAENSDGAMPILESAQPVDLLLTDVVMPGSRDGLALARDARRMRPALKVLHITGYPDRIPIEGGPTKEEVLAKPFRQSELLDRIGKLLGNWAVDRNPILRRAYEYWLEKAAGRSCPDRRDLHPDEIKEILPYLSIVELVGDRRHRHHRYRLVGTRVTDALGYNPTNLIVEEVADNGHAAFLRQLFLDVAAKRHPVYAASSFRASESGLATERVLLPFTRGGKEVRQIVIVQTFEWGKRKRTIHELTAENATRFDSIEHPPARDTDTTKQPRR